MKKNKLSDAQIISMLNEAAAGIAVTDLCRKYKVANSTFYKLKAKYTGMNLSDIQKLKALEEENHKLKQMYADVSLEHRILKEVLEKKYPELIGEN
jgi:putative transposase